VNEASSAGQGTTTASDGMSPASLAWALAPGTLLAGMAGGIAFPILPIAALRVGVPLAFIGVILGANRAVRVAASAFVGMLTDRFGGRRTLLVGLAVQAVVLGLYALGIVTGRVGPLFLAGRLLHGVASACVFISAQALALQAGGAAHSGRATSAVRTAIVLGVPAGLAVGGLLSDALGDAIAFVLAGCAIVVALASAFVRVPDLRAPAGARTRLADTLRAMRDARLVAVGVLNLVLNFATGGMILTTLALLVHERHLRVLGRNEQGTAGLLMGLMIVIDAATTPLAGRLGDRLRAHARVASGGMGVLALGLVVVGLSTRVPAIAAGLALVGVGSAGLGPSLLVIIGERTPRERRGAAVGLLQVCGDVGGMAGPLVGTTLFAGSTRVPYLATAVLVAACAPVALWLARGERARS
jgi:MFS family permease